jgi:hypothetical protein
MNIDPNWDLETAFVKISDRYRPGSYWHGRTRNVLLQMWGEVVGRTRAVEQLAALIEKSGSRNKFCREFSISSAPLADLESHFAALPPDPEPKRNRLNAGDRIGPWKFVARLGRGGNSEVWRATSDGRQRAGTNAPCVRTTPVFRKGYDRLKSNSASRSRRAGPDLLERSRETASTEALLAHGPSACGYRKVAY